jgi:hypothetical protein
MTPPLEASAEDLDEELLDLLAAMTPAERIARHDAALDLVLALRQAAKDHYGFDPRAVATADDAER